MSEKVKVILIAVLSVLLIAAVYLLYDRLSESYSPESLLGGEENKTEGENLQKETETEETLAAAKDFTVLDAEGKEIKLSEKFGRPIVLNFWASWCPPCKAEMPDFQSAYEKYGKDVEFMMINMTDGARETVDTAKLFIEGKKYSFPIYFDTVYDAAMAYEAYSLPSTYFISKDGKIVSYNKGMISASALEKGISLILNKGAEQK